MKALFLFLFIFPFILNGQIDVFLKLENQYNNKTQRFYISQEIEYSTIYDPGNWRKETIKNIIPEEDLIIFRSGYYHINEIHSLRTVNRPTVALGNILYGFGSSVVVMGGIGYASSGEIGTALGSVGIGGVIAAIGHFVKKLFGKRRHRIEKNRVDFRIIDTRFTVPENQKLPIRTP